MGIEAQIAGFVVNLTASYLLSRLTAQDGPRLSNLEAGGGEYGVGMPVLLGENARVVGLFIAQADIKETKHKVEDHSELVGALGGAVFGLVGAAIGGFLGAITPNVHYYTYSDSFALLFADRLGGDPVEGLSKVWASGKAIFSGSGNVIAEDFDGDGRLIWRKYGKNRWFKSMTIYTGHTDQPVNPVLSSLLGENSGFPFVAYAVFEDLQLADFGNGVPNPIEGLVKIETGQSLATAAEFICLRAGIDPVTDMSSTALNDDLLRGYALTNEISCWDALKPLLSAFGVDAAEAAGQIRFYRRSQSMRATIPPDEMGAYVYGDSPPEKFTFKRSVDLALPQETSLTFLDPARDYQQNTQSASRSEGDAQSNVSVSIPLVMTASEGANAVTLMHWDAWLGRTQVTFTLTDSWNSVEPGLAYAISVADQFVPYRITRKARGANGITEIEALSDESVTYSANVVGTSGTLPVDDPTEFADTRLILMDMSILNDSEDEYGFHVVMGGSQPYWTRGKIQIANGGDYVTVIDSPLSSVMGDVTGTLAAGTTDGLDDTLDTTTVLTVVLLHDEMELHDATDDELDAFGNFAFVGKDGLGEYLQFKTATFISGSTWQLTNLRRGRRGTDFAIASHASGEEFALLSGADGAGRFRLAMDDTTLWGDTLSLRGVSLHQDEADADVIAFTNTGEGKRPYSPVNVEGDWDGSDNVDITWDARSRMNAGGLGVDDQDNYEVEIISGAGRAIIATGVETVTYTASQQTTDGLTPGETIVGRVRQLSDVNNGRWRNFTIIGPNSITFDSTLITMDDTTLTMDAG